MNKKKNSLDIYWKDKLDFKYEKNYDIKCCVMIKFQKKIVKKYNINSRYGTFSD